MGARIALTLVLTLALAPAASAQDVTPQELFGRTIREDPGTTTAIRRLLESGAGFISARPLFADLTQDGKQDAVALVVTPGAVEKHISNIFSKLDLPAGDDDHRRVLAVLTFLRAGEG